MTSVVVCGLAGYLPLAGVGLHYLQYCLGLRDLGVEVMYLEDGQGWPLDPERGDFDESGSYSVDWLGELFGAFDLAWAYQDPAGSYHGAGEQEVKARSADADLLLNVSGSVAPTDHHRAARAIAYVDTDPAFTQVSSATDPAFNRYLRSYDLLFTFAESIGSPTSRLPDDGLPWKRTRQPVWLPFWEQVTTPPGDAYTTVMNWNAYGEAFWQGETWGQKDAEFHLIATLPAAAGVAAEVAVGDDAPRARMEQGGWRVADPRPPTRTVWAFRDYIAASRGELTVVKQAYARSRCGWFSERSANYLAAGRPVIAEDTGWSEHLPTGRGLFAFTSAEEAVAAVKEVESDPIGHGAAARSVAADLFDSRLVLERLLSDAGIG